MAVYVEHSARRVQVQSARRILPFGLSLLRKSSLDVVFMLILNGVSGIARATPLADWIAFAISEITLSKQQGCNLFHRGLRPYCMFLIHKAIHQTAL